MLARCPCFSLVGVLDKGPASGHVEGARVVLHTGMKLALCSRVRGREGTGDVTRSPVITSVATGELVAVVLRFAVILVHPKIF